MSWFTVASIVVSAAGTAYSSNRAKKNQEDAEKAAYQRQLITGSAPNLAAVEDIELPLIGQTPEGGGDLLAQAISEMDYAKQALTEEEQQQQRSMDAGIEQLLQNNPGLLGGDAQLAADGGPVGAPTDTYYFSVPKIMEMMQNPDPRVQSVGMGLADQTGPDMSMIPATPMQIEKGTLRGPKLMMNPILG